MVLIDWGVPRHQNNDVVHITPQQSALSDAFRTDLPLPATTCDLHPFEVGAELYIVEDIQHGVDVRSFTWSLIPPFAERCAAATQGQRLVSLR